MSQVINTELYLDSEQAGYCARAAGVARLAYNQSLSSVAKLRRLEYPVPSVASLLQEFEDWATANASYVFDIAPIVRTQAVEDYYKDITDFDLGLGKAPEFRLKGFHDFFRVYTAEPLSSLLYLDGNYIDLPGIGGVQTKPSNPPVLLEGRNLKEVSVFRGNRRWYARLTIFAPENP